MMHCYWNWSLNALTNTDTNTVQLAVLADGNDIPVCKMWLSRSACWHHQWPAYTVHLYSKKIAPCIFCSNFNKPRSVLIIYDMIQIFKLVCNGIAHRWVFLPYLVKCSKCTFVNDHRSLFPISTLMRDSVHIVYSSTSPAVCCYTTLWKSKIKKCYWFWQHPQQTVDMFLRTLRTIFVFFYATLYVLYTYLSKINSAIFLWPCT